MTEPAYLDPRSGCAYPLAVPRWRGDDGAPLLLTPLPGLTRDRIDAGTRSLWRYRAALPFQVETPITLGEGLTPLIPRTLHGADVLLKCEWMMPTGSFKDRGASVMLSLLRAQGIGHVLEDSSGNGGAAVAGYAAAGGMRATIMTPDTTSPGKTVQMRAYGAAMRLIPGSRQDTADAAVAAADEIFYASHNWHPFFLHGTKTLAYELWEDLGFRAPDNILVPCGAGSNVLGCAIGFDELRRAGAIERVPRLFAVQPANCGPIAASFRAGTDAEVATTLEPTIAEGTAIAHPIRRREVIAALRESLGGAVLVPEGRIERALFDLARAGVYVEPTSAQVAAGLETLLTDGTIKAGETTVLVMTGAGLKATARIAEADGDYRMTGPRVALLGFSIECNRFAPVTHENDFAARTLLGGPPMLANARSPAPMMLGEMPGFVADMDDAGPWVPLPGLLAMAEPNGPVSREFFARMMAQWEADLRAALPLDGVYCVLHGAGLTVDDHDPEGTLLAMVRRVVGYAVPVVATYDLHANVSEADVDLVNAFVGYRTNPHLDMRERGAEAAQLLRRLIGGTRTHLSRVRLPIVPPTVTQLTGKDAPERPYGELIDLGQKRMREAPYDGRVLNVSVMGGFAYADTPFNGLSVVVTATDREAADGLAREIAVEGWARRARFRPSLTSLEDAIAQARETEDASRHALILADVADNPGGGGRGTTMWILEALLKAGVQNGLVGMIHDPALAAEAHVLGVGATFTARFNREGGDEFSKPFSAEATVAGVRDQPVRGRRGIYANNTLDLGLCAALRIGGLTVVVIGNRVQCADPVFFEMFGLDIAAARVVVVKSRGHFRGGFDEFFRHGDVVEVDAPGLTSPVLSRFAWRHMPRPVLPIDDTATWTPPT